MILQPLIVLCYFQYIALNLIQHQNTAPTAFELLTIYHCSSTITAQGCSLSPIEIDSNALLVECQLSANFYLQKQSEHHKIDILMQLTN